MKRSPSQRILVCLVFLLVSGLIAAALILAPRRESPERRVDLTAVAAPEGPLPGNRRLLRFAVAPVMSPERSAGPYRALGEVLAARTGRSLEFVQRPDYGQINELIRQGGCDLALVCTYAYLRGQREFGMDAMVVPVVRGQSRYNSLIVVRGGLAAASLLDLRGRRFASADRLSNTGWIFPASWLRRNGQEPESFFGQHLITGSHDRSLRAVDSGFADGAAVSSLVFDALVREDPSLADRVRVILRSPDYGNPPLVAAPRLEPELRAALLANLLRLHEDERGREVLSALDIDRFVTPPVGYYDSVLATAAGLELP
jgi:phosphonate transport system substrate-binding protein